VSNAQGNFTELAWLTQGRSNLTTAKQLVPLSCFAHTWLPV